MSQAISLASERGLRPGLADCQFRNAELQYRQGDTDAAREQLEKPMALFREMEMPWWLRQDEMLRERTAHGRILHPGNGGRRRDQGGEATIMAAN